MTHAYSPEPQEEMSVKRVRRGQCSPIPGPLLALLGGGGRHLGDVVALIQKSLPPASGSWDTLSSKTKRRYTTNRLWFPLFGNHSNYRAFQIAAKYTNGSRHLIHHQEIKTSGISSFRIMQNKLFLRWMNENILKTFLCQVLS